MWISRPLPVYKHRMPQSAVSTPETRPARSPQAARTLRWVRKTHLYFGLLIAPALLFFALTGALQTFNLHESAGTSYQPPAWIAHLAQIHKNQTAALRPHRNAAAVPPAPAASGKLGPVSQGSPQPPAHPADDVTLASKNSRHLPLKIFFLLVSLGLFTSSLTGIFMAYRFERNNVVVTALLLAGTAIPLLLLRF